MKLIKKVLSNFTKQPDIWFFYGFLLTFTLSIRKVLFFYPIKGKFNEYTGIYIYLSDIFVVLTIVYWIVYILYNKILNKSIHNLNFTAYLKQKVVIIPFLLITFSFISANWSDNWQVALFRSIKLLEFYLLYLWVIFRLFHLRNNVPRGTLCETGVKQFSSPVSLQQNVPRGTFFLSSVCSMLRNLILILIFNGVIQSFIATWQFIAQKPAGLFWLKESLISPEISGVAKIVFNGDKYIRAYGLFPHPNILGGFLLLSIILTILYLKLFHVEQFKDGNKTNCSTWNNYIYYAIIGIQALALILTFSKSAWIGLIISLAYLYCVNVPRGTKVGKKLFHVEQFKNFALIAGIIILLVVLIKPNWYSIVGKGIQDRMFYLNVSRGTFLENPILGVGAGNFVNNMFKNYPNLEIWKYQPVHNVFLLILNELGIVGIMLFIWFIWEVVKNKMFHPDTNVPSRYKCSTWNILWGRRGTFYGAGVEHYLKAIFLGFLFIMLVDHYFWDIQQGQILFWLILAILSGDKLCITKQSTGLSTEK